jgi:hypothetical protein
MDRDPDRDRARPVRHLLALSTVGHALGLTPTYSKAFDSPDGWVDRHYRSVVCGHLR